MNIRITPYDCIEDVIDEALHKAMSDTNSSSLGFVGYIDTIQAILGVVLEDAGRVVDRLDMDASESDTYQLTITDDGFVSVVPIKNKHGDYLIVDADIRYVSDEMPLSYFRRLDTCGEEYTVFGFDYDDSEGEELSDEEAEDLLHNATFAVVYSRYGEFPQKYKDIIDLAIDWGLTW